VRVVAQQATRASLLPWEPEHPDSCRRWTWSSHASWAPGSAVLARIIFWNERQLNSIQQSIEILTWEWGRSALFWNLPAQMYVFYPFCTCHK
jgi:hypothetical protein